MTRFAVDGARMTARITGPGQLGYGHHGVGVSADSAQEPEVFDQDPVRQAKHRPATSAKRRASPSQLGNSRRSGPGPTPALQDAGYLSWGDGSAITVSMGACTRHREGRASAARRWRDGSEVRLGNLSVRPRKTSFVPRSDIPA